MQTMSTRKRTLSLLLVLAMLTLAFAALFPATVAADVTLAEDGEIEDYRYQTVTGTNVKTSEETDLRFLFSIDETKLNDYTAVGFVFSKSDDDPEKVEALLREEAERWQCPTLIIKEGEEQLCPM